MKLKTSIQLSVAIALAAQISGTNAKEQEAQLFYVTPSIGYHNFDNDRDLELKDDFYGALGFGFKLCSHMSVEGLYKQVNTESDDSTDLDVKYKQWNADFLYTFDRNGNAQPYVVAGLGDTKLQIESAKDDHDTSVTLGTGVKYWLNESLAVDTGVRLTHGLEASTTEPTFNLGLNYVLNAPKPVAAPAPEPVVQAAPAPKAPEAVLPVDSDGDGVYDDKDKCPGSAAGAKVDADGCYVMLKENVEVKLNIVFDNAAAVVKPQFMSEIEKVAKFLTDYPLTNVVVEGHTDDVGKADYNQRLSQKRAQSVADVLVKNYGIAASRVTAMGYGKNKPIASNKTPDGRQQNRRVVAVVATTVEKQAK